MATRNQILIQALGDAMQYRVGLKEANKKDEELIADCRKKIGAYRQLMAELMKADQELVASR